jgi:hypothetical protein
VYCEWFFGFISENWLNWFCSLDGFSISIQTSGLLGRIQVFFSGSEDIFEVSILIIIVKLLPEVDSYFGRLTFGFWLFSIFQEIFGSRSDSIAVPIFYFAD